MRRLRRRPPGASRHRAPPHSDQDWTEPPTRHRRRWAPSSRQALTRRGGWQPRHRSCSPRFDAKRSPTPSASCSSSSARPHSWPSVSTVRRVCSSQRHTGGEHARQYRPAWHRRRRAASAHRPAGRPHARRPRPEKRDRAPQRVHPSQSVPRRGGLRASRRRHCAHAGRGCTGSPSRHRHSRCCRRSRPPGLSPAGGEPWVVGTKYAPDWQRRKPLGSGAPDTPGRGVVSASLVGAPLALHDRGSSAVATAVASQRGVAARGATDLTLAGTTPMAIAATAQPTRPSATATPAGPASPARTPATPAPNASGRFSLARQLGLGIARIVIDPGHGGHDPGARVRGLTEADLVLDVALRLERLLRRSGIESCSPAAPTPSCRWTNAPRSPIAPTRTSSSPSTSTPVATCGPMGSKATA